MKILSTGNFLNPSWDGSLPDEEHIAGALEKLGHEVTRLQRGDKIPLTNGEGPPLYDWILAAQWDGYDIEWLHKAKNYFSCPLIYWAFDYQADGQEWHERLVAEADLYLSKRTADSKYLNWRWLAQDFAPAFLDSTDAHKRRETTQDIDVLFTGSYLPWAIERNETLKAVDEHFNLTIHSVNEWPGFKNQLGPIMDHDLPELYSRAKINLSIDHTIESGYWSDRNAQIMCCGGFVLFRHVPLSELAFHRAPIYLDTFENIGECLAKISYWLVNEETRKLTAELGYEYAQTHLKVEARVKDLISIVESL